MFESAGSQIDRRLKSLERHLEQENPVLLQVVKSFRELDSIAYGMGLLNRDESYATRVPWWPLIAILGTFSAGKSSFINSFLGRRLQRTGSQAVDDKFTVICYSPEEESHTLPGLALDADPRFPFYNISRDIESVAQGEGRRIDAYLQLKTCPATQLRGKILIDSPGFDADAQRTATLRITDHIMDLSDLVLVFFDARHPEPGAMKDTLDHLVANTIHRHDSNKFLFILNQIDCTVSEDNLEDVVAAWQRALAQSGLTAGRFYQIYNTQAATPIEDPSQRERYENKRAADMTELADRIRRVEIERAYRIIGALEHTGNLITDEIVPRTRAWLTLWRNQVLVLDGVALGVILAAMLGLWIGLGLELPALDVMVAGWPPYAAGAVALLSGITALHFKIRTWSAAWFLKKIRKDITDPELREYMERAFRFNTVSWRSIFLTNPAGWGGWVRRRLLKVFRDADGYVQNLNDQFTNPSGRPDAPSPRVVLDIEKNFDAPASI
ncbi:MAG: dynamin family protein [Magnetococcus sp. WYHC-3]